MQGRAFLRIARRLVGGNTEEEWRAAAGRAYYALYLECRDAMLRWGFVIPPRDNVHTFVRLRFWRNGDANLPRIGLLLARLGGLRNEADYQIATAGSFGAATLAVQAVDDARDALALLDQITADPAREASAIAAIQAAWP